MFNDLFWWYFGFFVGIFATWADRKRCERKEDLNGFLEEGK